MATSFGAAATSTALVSDIAYKSSAYLPPCHHRLFHRSYSNKVSFHLIPNLKLRFSSKDLHSRWNCSIFTRAQSNECHLVKPRSPSCQMRLQLLLYHQKNQSLNLLPKLLQSEPLPAVMSSGPTPSPMPTAASSPALAPAAASPKAQPSKSSHPPLKCPMAGTFYRSPAPGWRQSKKGTGFMYHRGHEIDE